VEKTLKVIGGLKKNKVILDYAIGGGIAVLYYVEPLLTYDLDILFRLKKVLMFLRRFINI
jgi:hypothetical protein